MTARPELTELAARTEQENKKQDFSTSNSQVYYCFEKKDYSFTPFRSEDIVICSGHVIFEPET